MQLEEQRTGPSAQVASAGRHERRGRFWHGPDRRLATALGWFSLGLGGMQVGAPGALSHLIGVRRRHRALLRILGVRELTTAAGILTQRRPTTWLWSRVAGDLVDLGLLAGALRARRNRQPRLLAVGGIVAALALIDLAASLELVRESRATRARVRRALGLAEGESILVNRSPADCYRGWRQLEALPRFVTHLDSVESIGDRQSRWLIHPERGKALEWYAETVIDRPNEVIGWRTLDGGGSGLIVRFEPAAGGRGTIVRLALQPGDASRALASLFSQSSLREHLRRFKMLIEAGEIATTRGQPAGQRSRKGRALLEGWRP